MAKEIIIMKKLIICVMLIVTVVCFAGCGSAIKVESFKSKYYDTEEYQAAVDEVMSYFTGFEGCEMSEIRYAGDEAVKAEAETRGMDCDHVMVLKCTFTTDGENHENGLEPDYTYEDYGWILTREFKDGMWTVEDHGYC
jgi:uncharacterized protein YceK